HRTLSGLDEHVDYAVATQAPPPHHLVVGGQVEVEQPWPAFGDHLGGGVADIPFQAPAADSSHGLAVFRHEEAGALPPVSGTLDLNDGGEGHAVAVRCPLF